MLRSYAKCNRTIIVSAHNSLQTSQNCYDQLTTCYDTAGPTGHRGCTAWEAYCGEVKSKCESGNFNGPPSADSYIPPPDKNLDESDSQAAPAPAIVGGESSSSDTYSTPQTNPGPTTADNSSGGSINTCGSNNGGLKCTAGMCCSSHG